MKKFGIIGGLLLCLSGQSYGDALAGAVLSCLLEPSQEIGISSQVAGIVKTMKVERGDRIRKGQALFSLESGVEQAALETARAKAEFASRKVERNKDLLKKGLLSDYEQDELLTDMKLGDLAVREAEVRLEQRTLISPVEGVVVQRLAAPGEYVGTDPVLELASLNPLHAELILQADYYGQIQPGAGVNLMIGQGQAIAYRGEVTLVDKLIDAASGTFGIQVRVPNPDFSLPAGLKCRIALAGE